MDAFQFAELVNDDLIHGLITPNSLTSRLPHMPGNIRSKPFFKAPTYYPAYFYMGRHFSQNSILTLSLFGGLPLSCFILGNPKKLSSIGAFHFVRDDFYSPRMAFHNLIRASSVRPLIYSGAPMDKDFQEGLLREKWGGVIIDEEMPYDEAMSYLRMAWSALSEDGLLFVDRINYSKLAERPFLDFCKEIGREYAVINSKYGIGVISK